MNQLPTALAAPRPAVDRHELHGRLLAARETSVDLMIRSARQALLHRELTLLATTDAPAVLRRVTTQLLQQTDATETTRDDALLVVSELANNAVQHAYTSVPGPLDTVLSVIGSSLTIVMSDEGRGPRAESPCPGLGIGWRIVARLAERFAIASRGGGGTTVYARVRLTPAA